MGLLYLIGIAHQLMVHLLNIPLADRQIVRRIVLAFPGLPHPLHIQLQSALEAGGLRHNVDIVQSLKIIDPLRVRIPDLRVHHTGLVLQNQVLIGLSVFRHRRLTLLAQIDAGNALAFPDAFYIFHRFSLVLSVFNCSVSCSAASALL